ncbi:tRNA pseudouridine(13) synthase TruD [Candidatus Parcubacteria bacterium]|nr:tRNA pseudouridine(13) synthase TruD [Candidatus Parcubacteria bacterium]
MPKTRLELMSEQEARIEAERNKNPELFPETTWVDDNKTLESLGIYIPGKELLAKGFLKLLPSDFIVEEITSSGRQTTVSEDSENLENKPGETIYATLVKCGLSTIEAVEELSSLLNVTRDKIQYAGIKDKDAITSQEISIRSVSKEKVLSINSPHFFLKDIYTGKGVLNKGQLLGNRFTILMRIGEDLHNKSKMNESFESLKSLRKEGFYNYFYLQRFGTPRLNNYKWALLILRGEYEKAVRSVISDPGMREIPYFIKMREDIISLAPNWEKVLEKLNEFPLVFPTEIKIIQHLVKSPGDFSGALRQVEEQVMLWISALASMLFNRKLSAYAMAKIKPPHSLPLFLSPDRNDWLPYSEDLEGLNLFPPEWNNLRPFRSIQLRHREVETMDRAEIHEADITDEGIVVQFTLGKGEYATTFLSHFVNLMTGMKPEEISENIIDVKSALKIGEIKKTLDYFSQLNKTK